MHIKGVESIAKGKGTATTGNRRMLEVHLTRNVYSSWSNRMALCRTLKAVFTIGGARILFFCLKGL
jgi:hypothetical protein